MGSVVVKLQIVANLIVPHHLCCMCSTPHAATVVRLHVLIDTIYCLPFPLRSLVLSLFLTLLSVNVWAPSVSIPAVSIMTQ